MYKCVPVEANGSVLKVAFADPLNPAIIDELGFVFIARSRWWWPTRTTVERPMSKYYGEESGSVSDVLKELGADAEMLEEVSEVATTEDVEELASLANETPIVKFVNLVLLQAIQDRASDIHFEPFEDEFKIRYRVDGVLYEMVPPPKHLALPVISRIKVMANLNIAERRLPQDGRISYHVAGRPVDLRVSTLPTLFGETVVLRVLDRAAVSLDLEPWASRRHVRLHRPRPSSSPTASSSSPARPAPARPPRSTPACGRSTPSTSRS